MPVNKAAHFRFEIIDECLRNTKKKWSKNKLLIYINRRLTEHYGEDVAISKSQLRYDLGNMQSEYGAPIEMFREGRECYYYYEDPEFSIKSINVEEYDLMKLTEAAQILEQINCYNISFEINNLIRKLGNKYNFKNEQERNTIIFESFKEMPGMEFFEDIHLSILQKNVLKIFYRAQEDVVTKIFTIHPYLLKQYEGQWYMVGYCTEEEKIRAVHLGCIAQIKIANIPFKESENTNIDALLKNIIGISMPQENKSEEIVLSISSKKAGLIRRKPLHWSQRILRERTDGKIEVLIDIIINSDFFTKLISFGNEITILSPAHIIQQAMELTTLTA